MHTKTLKSAIITALIGSVLCLLLASVTYIVVFHIFPQPLIKEPPPEVTARIAEIHDIEHLRKMTLLLDSQNREQIRDFNRVFSSAVHLLIVVFVLGAVFCVATVMNLLKALRELRGETPPWWLRWL
jgi:RsiW-degrading membrane proteinase PrsW (M82 family)